MLSAAFRSALPALFALVMGLGALAPVAAQSEIMLSVETQDAQLVTYSRDDLAALPRVSFKTSTIWTEGVKEFSGVPLKALLQASGITTGSVRAIAVNDYLVEIPVEDLEDNYPIVADMIDGKAFSRREKGPVWVVYPYDKSASYRTEEKFGRSIWQLVKLVQK